MTRNENTIDSIETQLIATAKFHLNKPHRICVFSEATVTYPDFDPCKSIQVVARVHVPAVVSCKLVTLTHSILDGDQLFN